MLIIFFVLSTAFVRGTIEVDLPQGEAPRPGGNPVVVSVTADGTILWMDKPASLEDLRRLVGERSGDILIAGDREAPYGAVAGLIDELRRLGVTSVGMAYGAK